MSHLHGSLQSTRILFLELGIKIWIRTYTYDAGVLHSREYIFQHYERGKLGSLKVNEPSGLPLLPPDWKSYESRLPKTHRPTRICKVCALTSQLHPSGENNTLVSVAWVLILRADWCIPECKASTSDIKAVLPNSAYHLFPKGEFIYHQRHLLHPDITCLTLW